MDLSIYNEFVEEYNNPQLTIEDIKRKLGLNCKRFAEIQQIAIQNNDISSVRRMNRTDAKFYTKTKNGYVVKKQFGTDCLFVGRFETQETAELVVEECKKVNWNTSLISDFIEEQKIQPRNYTARNDSYIVQKTVDGKNTVFCTVNTESIAQKVVKEFRKCNWDKTKTNEILKKVEI